MSIFDATLNSLEESRFLKKTKDIASELEKVTHLSFVEIQMLLILYYKLQKKNHREVKDIKDGGVSKLQFAEVMHKCLQMTDSRMTTNIITAMDKTSRSRYITMETWIKTLSLFLRGTLEEQILFCFNVYDTTNSGLLTRDVLFRFLRHSMFSVSGEGDAEEAVKDLLDIIIKKMDLDRDNKISFNDYREFVLKNPQWLEFLGPCLPDRQSIYAFQTTFMVNLPNY
nr:unnamed protein product [Callosobruchus analis]